ncbi:hypothetical protein HYH03_007629 [Edaphochlamys debaryana]|uniref:Glycoside hydrolase family 16 protein n=2 Tax=Edaphochlamys debaryana TaxID=47281 RepID=A0A836BYX0_9CHLO|nr:hypothetical protein HYH03_007629 [Edaphochlamys debaryana]|eukprot:KAG2494276.1 hypothetical protein HYH03_007629 [Edaphochlamys debaryana]
MLRPTSLPLLKSASGCQSATGLDSQCLFQMLPDTSRTDCLACGAYGEGWCSSGQIDVAVARNGLGYVDSTLHWGGTEANSASGCQSAMAGSGYTYNPAEKDYGDWFLVTMLWSADGIAITVGQQQTINLPATAWYTGSVGKINNPVAPYDQPFYLVLTLAVCGEGALINGNCEANAGLSMGYQVDWVKLSFYP